MDPRIESIFNETISMERKAAEFYYLLANLFREDGSFWNDLAAEEEYHAVLLHGGRDRFFERDLFPVEALEPNLVKIRKASSEIDESMSRYSRTTPPRKVACMRALEMEGSSGEYYFQLALDIPAGTPALQLLRSLTGVEMNHAHRIIDRFMGPAHTAM